MGKKYKYTVKDARQFNKHGIDLTIYGQDVPLANVVHASVKKGHFQEFYNLESTYTYYIISGRGTFYLDDEPVQAEATDLIVVPPNTRIHYLNEKNEHHVRFVD